jgi:hypothetical protein
MQKRSVRTGVWGLLLAAITVSGAVAQQPTPIQLPARWSYAAKFVCGFSPTTTGSSVPKEPPVKRGNYATVVNIHNPNAGDVTILKKVVLAAPETYPNTVLTPPTKRYKDRLPSDHAMSVNCTEIVNLLVLNGTPPAGPFIEGFLVIDALGPATSPVVTLPELDVVTVTTTAIDVTSAVNSHQIHTVQGKQLPAGTWAF